MRRWPWAPAPWRRLHAARGRLAVVTESELYAATARTRTRRDSRKAATMEGWLRDLSELKPGDPVVHQPRHRPLHGPGHMDLGEGQTEFLHLEYANGDKLYVPVSQLHVISRYAGADPEAASCTAGLRPVGKGQAQGRRAGATPPPSCSRSTPSAPRARATVRLQAARLRSRRRLRLRETPTSRPPSTP
jgi:hypothetical protein